MTRVRFCGCTALEPLRHFQWRRTASMAQKFQQQTRESDMHTGEYHVGTGESGWQTNVSRGALAVLWARFWRGVLVRSVQGAGPCRSGWFQFQYAQIVNQSC